MFGNADPLDLANEILQKHTKDLIVINKVAGRINYLSERNDKLNDKLKNELRQPHAFISTTMSTYNPLRSVSHRLNSTPVQDLPIYAGFLASCILNCAESFKASKDQEGEASVVLHRLRSRVSSLLQDRSPEGRFVGVVLAKSIIDAGGITDLSVIKSWVRSLLTCLNKTQVPELQKLIIITLTRVFLLSANEPSHIREITTPVLPSFITACLLMFGRGENVSEFWKPPKCRPLVAAVLQCWIQLLPQFPGTFRPYTETIRASNQCLLSDPRTPETIRSIAMKLYAMLHLCAPKNTTATEWTVACERIIGSLHQTANVLFRSVIEDWTTSSSLQVSIIGSKISEAPRTRAKDNAGLLAWSGLREGQYRIITLLLLLAKLLESKQSEPALLPLSMVLDVVARFAAVVPPHSQFSLRLNHEIGRDEREELWSALPLISVALLKLISKLALVYGQILQPVGAILLFQVCDIFEGYASFGIVREAIYQVTKILITKRLVHPQRSRSPHFLAIVTRCCSDLRSILPATIDDHETKKSSMTNLATLSLTLEQASGMTRDTTHGPQTALQFAAWDLATAVLKNLSTIIPTKLRAELDAAIILIGHQQAMLSSVLNPQQARNVSRNAPSIMPFLARTEDQGLMLESLLRPRMPLIRTIEGTADAFSGDDQDAIATPGLSPAHIAPRDDTADNADADGDAARQISDGTVRSPWKRSFTTFDSDVQRQVPEDDQAAKRSRVDEPLVVSDLQPAILTGQNGLADLESEDPVRENTQQREGRAVIRVEETAFKSTTDIGGQSSTVILGMEFDPVPASPDLMLSRTGLDNSQGTGNDEEEDDDDVIPTIDTTISDEDEEATDEDQ